MKRRVIILSVFLILIGLLVVLALTRPYSVTLSGGDIPLSTLGFIKMETENRVNPDDRPIEFKFYYGHTLNHPESYSGTVFYLDIYLIDIYSQDKMDLYSIRTDEILVERNTCDVRYMGYWQYYSSCPTYFSYSLDFLEYGITEGFIYYRITMELDTDYEDAYEEIRIGFTVDNNHVTFHR